MADLSVFEMDIEPVEIVNEMGERVALLYDETPPGDVGFCLRYRGTHLPSGTYYIHVQNPSMGRAVKLQFVR